MGAESQGRVGASLDIQRCHQGGVAKDRGGHARSRQLSKLGAFLLFFITYLLVLYLQLTPSSVFEVETSIREAVFSPNSGMVDESGRVVARVSDAEDIYSLLEKSLLPMYTHVTCGDGKCDDGEKPWYAGDGCVSDCGIFKNVTKVNFNFVWNAEPTASGGR